MLIPTRAGTLAFEPHNFEGAKERKAVKQQNTECFLTVAVNTRYSPKNFLDPQERGKIQLLCTDSKSNAQALQAPL